MTREDILSGFENLSVSEQDFLVDIVDHFEIVFSDIEDLLDIKCLDDLSGIEEAKTLASKANTDLY
tara:strand:- start:1582 stop:1779 length:198 start_codon:yes stop_codon:yes gene_type:complete